MSITLAGRLSNQPSRISCPASRTRERIAVGVGVVANAAVTGPFIVHGNSEFAFAANRSAGDRAFSSKPPEASNEAFRKSRRVMDRSMPERLVGARVLLAPARSPRFLPCPHRFSWQFRLLRPECRRLRAALYGLRRWNVLVSNLPACATIYCFLFASAVRKARFRRVSAGTESEGL